MKKKMCIRDRYERVLKQQNALNVLEKTQKFSLPFVSGSGKGKAYMEQLVWGELGDFTRQLIREEQDGRMGTGRTEPAKKTQGTAGSVSYTHLNEDFKDFVKKCHEAGIRVVVDGVFNHTGREFFAFQDIQKNREQSPYVNWYKGCLLYTSRCV